MKNTPILIALAALVGSAVVASANPADTNKDKRISLEEFEAVKRKEAENQGRPYNAEGVKNTFAEKDHDGNGSLSYREMANHAADVDGDKKISFDEFRRLQAIRAERNGRTLDENWLKDTFAKRDQDGDGTLSYPEMNRPLN